MGKFDYTGSSIQFIVFLNCRKLNSSNNLDYGLYTVYSLSTENCRGTEVPLKAAGARDKSEAYASFLNNVNEFRDLNQLPVELNFDREMDVDQLVKQE